MANYIKRIIDGLEKWYVFNVYSKADSKKLFFTLCVLFVLASIFDNFLKSIPVNKSFLIWLAVLLLGGTATLNHCLLRGLEGILHIHSKAGNNNFNRFFLRLEKKTSTISVLDQADFIFYPKFKIDEIEIIKFSVSFIKKSDEVAPSGLIKKKSGEITFFLDLYDREATFNIFVYLSKNYDLKEVLVFVGKQYYNKRKIYESYEHYLVMLAKDLFPSVLTEVCKQLDEKARLEEDLLVPFEDFLELFKKVLVEKFQPIKLSNVEGFELALAGDNEVEIMAIEKECEKILVEKN
jgi:hypothetical protein